MADEYDKPWFLKQHRLRAGLTLEELAEAAGTSKGYVSDLETGKRRYNRVWVQRFSRALGLKPGELFEDPDALTDPSSGKIVEMIDRLYPEDKKTVLRIVEAMKKTKK